MNICPITACDPHSSVPVAAHGHVCIHNTSAVDTLMPQLMATIPAGRCGTAEEISCCVCYLLSQGAAYTTGVCVRVDGGQGLSYMTPLVSTPQRMNIAPYGLLDPKARL